MTEIIKPHPELVRADRLAHIPHDLLDLGPSMHAVAVVVPHVVVELQGPLAVVPRLDAQFLVAVAPPVVHRQGLVIIRVAAGHAPAVFGSALGARDALADVHVRWGGTAFPVEVVDVVESLGIVFEVHVGGDLGLRVGVVVFGGADAGDLAEGVEVCGPPDRVPYLEVFGPIAVFDGAGVGSVPGLVKLGVFGVGEDGSGFFDGVVEDSGGDAVEDTNGAGRGCWDFVVVDDGEGWAGGGPWVHKNFDERLVGNRVRRHHGNHGGGRGRSDCGGLHE